MARVIMIQGTMSSAGKSFLTAGLCRIFRQDGYSVAPFKSQNMALNSYITADGLEMGRAQVMQAEAAGIAPEAVMNPILLKPTSHMGSQLIVNGEVRGNYSAAEYFRMKKSLIPDVMAAYESLAERFDVIVVEGAGSPAEINLRENDIVNMGLAELIDAPVLLAGDIDRGGVFAQLYGTVALVTEAERARIKGLVINKFRGDKEILKPGLSMLYDRCRIPVAGVVPYMDVDVDDEDSLADRLGTGRQTAVDREGREAFARIAVVRLPRISNFTDFGVLERLPGVAFSYVTRPEALSGADLILIPGTKNTMGDLKWMRETGMEAAVLRAASEGTLLFGVCGGFQMLGEELSDPSSVEEGGILRGMGLLPVRTVFAEKKTRTRVTGTADGFGTWRRGTGDGLRDVAECGAAGREAVEREIARAAGLQTEGAGAAAIEGYEIHMGETFRMGGQPFARIRKEGGEKEPGYKEDGGSGNQGPGYKEDGCVLGNVAGSYVHGLFDSEPMQLALWRLLAEKKNLPDTALSEGLKNLSVRDYKEKQYDRMAEVLRESLDMDFIYRILNREV